MEDTESGVLIEFFVTGDYPGDSKPKPIQFPDPKEAVVDLNSLRIIAIRHLIELKLASGMTHPGRLQDIADVMQLIEKSGLDADFASQLHPFVQEKYKELWQIVHSDLPP